jgi:hypothetical protein
MDVFETLKDFPFDTECESLSDWCSGNRNRFYGLKHTEESKRAMSEALKEQFVNGRVAHNKGKYAPDNEVGYSALYMREYRQGKKKILKDRRYVTPDGETILIKDVKKYCRENGLTYSSMLRLHKGELNQHKGYKKAPVSPQSQ